MGSRFSPDLLERVEQYLRAVYEYTEADVFAVLPAGMHIREQRLLLWEAKQNVQRDTGIVFRPDDDNSCVFRRAEPDEIVGRGLRFFGSGYRKVERAVELVRLGAVQTVDPQEKERAERLALRIANKGVDMRGAVRGASRPRPKGV